MKGTKVHQVLPFDEAQRFIADRNFNIEDVPEPVDAPEKPLGFIDDAPAEVKAPSRDMNKTSDTLFALLHHIKSVPHKLFDMREYSEVTPCGTAYCIAGYAEVLWGRRKYEDYIKNLIIHTGITEREGDWLCMLSNYDNIGANILFAAYRPVIVRKEALGRLRHLALKYLAAGQ